MKKNSMKLTGLILEMSSFFLLIGGLYLKDPSVPGYVNTLLIILGLMLLALGTVLFKILKGDD